MPQGGDTVEIMPGHRVVYDHSSDSAFRMVHILGTLAFSRDCNTRLDVGLLKIGGDSSEDGFSFTHADHSAARPVLEVGTQDEPIPAGRTARIRLHYFDGDRDSLPAIVCCGGRMDFHGAPMNRTWLKLGAPAKQGSTEVVLAEPVAGWRVGDRILLTATTRQQKTKGTFRTSTRDNTQTEECILASIEQGVRIGVTEPLRFDHKCEGDYRGDVANLSRNVTVESGDRDVARGHTMYHHGSAGSISYAEFRGLGKTGVLGRYSLHFHKVRDSMRGASVIGASIWDSGNRWLTVHGTDYLVVRDCVGYNSIGHGYFLEDGTEVFNVFDRNLAVQACGGKPLPDQVLPFDHNDGAGFWWANSRNAFVRNVACECDEYGFRFDIEKTVNFNAVLAVPRLEGPAQLTDLRKVPFLRFEDNEAHCMRRHAFNLGGMNGMGRGGCGGVGPDEQHPFVIRNMRVWNSHWAFHTHAPSVMVDGFDMHDVEYGLWRQNFTGHAYRGVRMELVTVKDVFDPFRGALPTAADFPKPLMPVDDLAPVTVVTYVGQQVKGKIAVRGVTVDGGVVVKVTVNGRAAKMTGVNYGEWEAAVDAAVREVLVRAEDAAGNVGIVRRAGVLNGFGDRVAVRFPGAETPFCKCFVINKATF